MRGFVRGALAFLFCAGVFIESILFFALWVGFSK